MTHVDYCPDGWTLYDAMCTALDTFVAQGGHDAWNGYVTASVAWIKHRDTCKTCPGKLKHDSEWRTRLNP